jgi:flagellar assembly protein FliH
MERKDPADKSIETYDLWELPALDAHSSSSTWQIPKNEAIGLSFPSVQELEAIRHAAHQEGMDQGVKQGQQQITDAVSRLAAVAGELYLQLQDQQFQQVMAELVMKICKVVLQRELSFNTQQIHQIVEQALTLLPVNTAQAVIYLHPQDLALINTHRASLSGWRDEWTLKANAQLAPGGCVVESAKTRIDASVEQRFYEVVTALFADDSFSATNASEIFKDPLLVRSDFLTPERESDARSDAPVL